MSGAGKWIKKHPLETVAIVGAGLTGGASLGLLGGGAAAGELAAGAVAGDAFLPGMLGAGAGNVAVAGDAFLPGMLGAGGQAASVSELLLANPAAKTGLLANMGAGLGKAEPYLKLANQANDLLSSPQRQPMAMPQQRGPTGPLQSSPLYGPNDAEEEERRRMLMAMLMQQGAG